MTAAGRVIAVEAGEGHRFRIGADRVTRKGPVASGSDGFSVVEYEGAPGFPGPPPHVHRAFEEAWYILEGQVSFLSRGTTVSAQPGTYLFVPRDVPHTFRVEGTTPARWIGIFSPGRYVELLEKLGALLPPAGPPDPAALRRLFAAYDTDLVE